MDVDVSLFLQKQRQSVPDDLKEFYLKFEDMYDKKLWHQLSIALDDFLKVPASTPFLISLYENFIFDWEKKMNQIRLVQFVTKASKQFPDPKKSLEFINSLVIKLKENKKSKDAYVLALMEAAHYKLLVGDLEGCKAAIDECEKILADLSGIETAINASFYRVSADYYKAKAAYPQYYHNALLFLSSVQLEDISIEEQVERARDLALSALLGEGLYNFGELALLSAALPFLVQKLCLMTLIEAVFKRTKEARGQITFSQFAHECRVGIDEVEHLVMKAFSLGVIKGQLDEIDQIVQISWVQPRVLDRNQIGSLRDHLAQWSGSVREHVLRLESEEGLEEVFIREFLLHFNLDNRLDSTPRNMKSIFTIIAAIALTVSSQSGCQTPWDRATEGEKQTFLSALRNFKSNRGYDKWVERHYTNAGPTHGTYLFLPWHRAMLNDFERELGSPLLYWDWTADSAAPHYANIFQPAYFGTNGKGPKNCVSDGVAASWTTMRNDCLIRCFDRGDTINNFSGPEVVTRLLQSSNDFSTFSVNLESTIHAQIHNGIGGQFATCAGDMSSMSSPDDPIFWLHHANIDRLWARWQKSCPATRGEDFSNSKSSSISANEYAFPYSIQDTMWSGSVCHTYSDADSDIAFTVNGCPDATTTTASATQTATGTASSTAAAATTAFSDKVVNFNAVDPSNANEAWLINRIKSLLPAPKLKKRDDEALLEKIGDVIDTAIVGVKEGLEEGKEGLKEGFEKLTNATENLFENATSIVNETLSSINGSEVIDTVITLFKLPENVTEAINTLNFTDYFEIIDFPHDLAGNSTDANATEPVYITYEPLPEVKIYAPEPDDEDPILLSHPPPIAESWLKMNNLDVYRVRALEVYTNHLVDTINNMEGYVSPGCLSKQRERSEKYSASNPNYVPYVPPSYNAPKDDSTSPYQGVKPDSNLKPVHKNKCRGKSEY
ncbi:26S proteasome regulatory subunit [Clydaea vesicula]|uniref:26S proteasome regulatory subunit n=1 Tax=Clydaea vesicula TaxID=447962 RepID=A0AAD5U6Y0_9FUNG|nr:26S proteasome regulatory subunit [Clydaea vesicula]